MKNYEPVISAGRPSTNSGRSSDVTASGGYLNE